LKSKIEADELKSKIREEELKSKIQAEEFRAKQESMGIINAVTSHELRNPLNSIIASNIET
jgi:signal transduction histidine kinase